MISCPAAKQMRWVNPSIATVSPSRTISATASRIVATLLMRTSRPSRLGFRHLRDGFLEHLERRPGLIAPEHERRRQTDDVLAGAEHEKPAPERGVLDRDHVLVIGELHADHQP